MADIASPQAAAGLVAAIRASGLAPERVILEVTETALIQDVAQAQTVLETLKATGIAIALDDFGTGYSSLSYVHRLPLDKLKIDRSFVSESPPIRPAATSSRRSPRSPQPEARLRGGRHRDRRAVASAGGTRLRADAGLPFPPPMSFSDTLRYLDAEAVRAIRPVQAVARQHAVA